MINSQEIAHCYRVSQRESKQSGKQVKNERMKNVDSRRKAKNMIQREKIPTIALEFERLYLLNNRIRLHPYFVSVKFQVTSIQCNKNCSVILCMYLFIFFHTQ